MFERVLVPLDGSSLAERALPHAAVVAGALEAEVVLLRVMEGVSGAPLRPADPLTWQMRKMEGAAYLDKVRSRMVASGLQVRTEILEGNAATRIVEYAQAIDCDLLVMSTHGRGGLAPWSAGSVTQKVLERVKTSVLLVRAFGEGGDETLAHRYQRIVLPLDGSQRAESVLPVAVRLAERWHASLLLIHVVARTQGIRLAAPGSGSDELAEELARRTASDAADYLRRIEARLGVGSEVRVVVSDKAALAIESEVSSGDLVLASAHGYGCDSHRRYGSTIGEDIHYGSGPLLIFQEMRPEQISATALETAVQEMRGERPRNDVWPLARPERINWHANAA